MEGQTKHVCHLGDTFEGVIVDIEEVDELAQVTQDLVDLGDTGASRAHARVATESNIFDC